MTSWVLDDIMKNMKNIKLTLQYDGAAYHGWQLQPNAVTVQETVETAVAAVTGEHCRVIGCGRTDAGVHAMAYVCNFKTNASIPVGRLPYALNTKLPSDIVCFHAAQVNDDFHSGNSAKKKCYVYKILNQEFPDPFYRGRVWHHRGKLNIDAMKTAAKAFLGTHDFLGFASAGFTVKTTVRTIYEADIFEEGGLICFKVTGNGFLYNMVRIMAGTLVFAGTGKIDPGTMEAVIASRDRKRAGITAPPDGLYLWGVEYA